LIAKALNHTDLKSKPIRDTDLKILDASRIPTSPFVHNACLVEALVGWSVGWLKGCLVEGLVNYRFGWLKVWLVEGLVG